MDSVDGDREVIEDEGAESCDKRGEETMGDGNIGSAIVREAGAIGRMGKGSTVMIDVSRKVRKKISSTKRVKEDGRG